jgi:membrane-associated phospholipid phosphatase
VLVKNRTFPTLFCITLTAFLIACSGIQSSSFANRNEANIELAGDILQVSIPLAAYVTTLAMDDDEGKGQLAKSIIANVSVTYGLKLSIDKDRPEGHGKLSFPSAHSASSFQGATFLYRRYGWRFGVPAYVAAAFVAYSREEASKHDTVDVLSGATIGILSSYLFTTPYEDILVAPVAGDGYYGIHLAKTW